MKYKYKFRLVPWSGDGYSVEIYKMDPPDPECNVEYLTAYIKPHVLINQEVWPDGFWLCPSEGRYNKVHRPQIIEQLKIFLIKEML